MSDNEGRNDPGVAVQPETWEEEMGEVVLETAEAATTTTFGRLTRGTAEGKSALTIRSGEVAISDMVRQLIRPTLREWVDENLPGIVERVVRREIQKLMDRAKPDD